MVFFQGITSLYFALLDQPDPVTDATGKQEIPADTEMLNSCCLNVQSTCPGGYLAMSWTSLQHILLATSKYDVVTNGPIYLLLKFMDSVHSAALNILQTENNKSAESRNDKPSMTRTQTLVS